MDNAECPFEPRDHALTPEKLFDRQWAVAMIMRVLKRLEAECQSAGKATHYAVFVRRIIDPILHGVPEVPL
jgi:hypothetical protein